MYTFIKEIMNIMDYVLYLRFRLYLKNSRLVGKILWTEKTIFGFFYFLRYNIQNIKRRIKITNIKTKIIIKL